MKLQDVILKAIARKITWLQAADIAGMSLPSMVEKRHSYETFGYSGLFDQLPGRRVIYRVPMATVEKVLELYQTNYAGISPRLFHRELASKHNIRLNYSWVRQALQGAGLLNGDAVKADGAAVRKHRHASSASRAA